MELQHLTIRSAEKVDAAAVTECVRSAYQHYVEMIGLPPLPLLDDYVKVIEEKQVSVIEGNGRVIALIVMEQTGEGFLLNNIAVEPQYQGNGIGRLLLQFAEDEACRQGYDAIYLYTNAKMVRNQKIYLARGYAVYDQRSLNGRETVFMRKKL